MFFIELFVIFLLILLSTFLSHFRRRRQHPPGSLGLPFLGILPYRVAELIFSRWIKKTPDALRFRENKEKYGPIWSAEFGRQRLVTLASCELITEAFLDNADLFSGRSRNSAFTIISRGRGIIFTDGEMWRGNRQLAIKSLKDLGMGKNDLEIRIIDEADNLVSFLEFNSSKPVNLVNILSKGLSNVISRLVFCHGNDYNEPHFETYIRYLRSILHSDIPSRILSLSPYLFQTPIIRKIFPNVDNFLKANEYCHNFISSKCSNRAKIVNDNIHPDCVFDNFQKCRFSNSSAVSIEEQKEEVIHSMFDLFNAGIDTTSNLLSFCFLFLGKHQDIQKDLRNEINELVEDGRRISGDIRKSCPKYLSFIDEVHRLSSIVPKAHHRVLKDCIFHGYELYSDDIIFADLVNVHQDPSLFENPQQFNAYRFTDKSKTKYEPSKFLIPFGLGKRSCLGESIATIESFIFFEKIIRKFIITLTKETMDSFDSIIDGHSGLIHAPLDHLVCLTLIEAC